AVAAIGAYLLRRWPWLLALAVLACVPARIPVTVGSTQANLLVPLYGVVVAAALALGWELVRGDRRSRELGPVALPLAAFVGWTGLSLAWTTDLRQGAIELLFFYLPFALLAVCLARLAWRRRWVLALFAELVAMALVFSIVGVEQWITRDIFWNPKMSRVIHCSTPTIEKTSAIATSSAKSASTQRRRQARRARQTASSAKGR